MATWSSAGTGAPSPIRGAHEHWTADRDRRRSSGDRSSLHLDQSERHAVAGARRADPIRPTTQCCRVLVAATMFTTTMITLASTSVAERSEVTGTTPGVPFHGMPVCAVTATMALVAVALLLCNRLSESTRSASMHPPLHPEHRTEGAQPPQASHARRSSVGHTSVEGSVVQEAGGAGDPYLRAFAIKDRLTQLLAALQSFGVSGLVVMIALQCATSLRRLACREDEVVAGRRTAIARRLYRSAVAEA
jgi:hypothetical protein